MKKSKQLLLIMMHGVENLILNIKDIPRFCKSATLEKIRKHDHILTPGNYIGTVEKVEDEEAFEEKRKINLKTCKTDG